MSFSAPVRKLNIIIVIETNVIIIYKCFPNVTGCACAYAYASMIKSGTEGTYGPEGVAEVLTGNGSTTSDPGETAPEAPEVPIGPDAVYDPSALAQYLAFFLISKLKIEIWSLIPKLRNQCDNNAQYK